MNDLFLIHLNKRLEELTNRKYKSPLDYHKNALKIDTEMNVYQNIIMNYKQFILTKNAHTQLEMEVTK